MNEGLIKVKEVEVKDKKTGKIKVGLSGKLPAITPLETIRYCTHGHSSYWGSTGYRPLFVKEALQYLKKQNVYALQDLEGWNSDKLNKVPGLGPTTVSRILKCLRHSSVKHRGIGYPWELGLTVQVPTQDVELLYQYDQTEVEEALAHHVATNLNVFPQIQGVLLAKKKADLLMEEKRLEGDMRKLKKRLNAVSADAARI